MTHRWCEPLTPLTWERGSVYPKCAKEQIRQIIADNSLNSVADIRLAKDVK